MNNRLFALLGPVSVRLLLLLATLVGRLAAQQVSISLPTSVSVPEDTVARVPFSLNGLASGDEPVLTVRGLNPRLVQTNLTTVLLTGSSGFIELTPVPNQVGGTEFSVSLQLGTRIVSQAGSHVSWTAVDDPPDLESIPPQVTTQGAPPMAVPLRYRLVDSPGIVFFTASSSRSNFVQTLAVTRVGTNSVLTLRPSENALGTTIITVQGSSGRATNRVSFPFTILRPEMASQSNVGQTLALADTASWADVNGDGFVDLISNGATSSTVSLQSYSPTETRWTTSTFQSGIEFTKASWGDYDGDGDVDAWLTLPAGAQLLRNDTPLGKSAKFVPPKLALPVIRPTSATWADFDGEGDLDLLLTGTSSTQSSGSLLILRNDGHDRFTPVIPGLPSTSQPALAADFDDDGLPDILSVVGIPNTGTNLVVHYNRGNLVFTSSSLSIPVKPVIALGTVDANGDGRLDVWVQHGTPATAFRPGDIELTLCLRTSQGFTTRGIVPVAALGSTVGPAWGDFDGDGEPDFIAPRVSSELYLSGSRLVTSNCFSVYRHVSGDTYAAGGFLSLSAPGRPVVADVGSDSSLDVWLPRTRPSPVFLNQFRPGNVPPGTPPDLAAFNLGRTVLFTWGRADDQNQAAPLTYNLRVGSRPGANDVVASMSTASGTRLVPEPGNTGMARQRFLELPSLDAPELYWSVQAVDNSYAAGAWAPEQKLSLPVTGTNQPPVLSGLKDQVLPEDVGRNVAFTVSDDRTRTENLLVEVVSANRELLLAYPTNVIGNQNVSSQLIALVPQPNQSGTTTVIVTVTDRGGLKTQGQFAVEVQPVNDPPTISELGPQVGKTGEPIGPLEFTVGDPESPPEELRVEVTLLGLNGPIEGIATTLSGAGSQRFVTVTSSALSPRSARIELSVIDPQGARTGTYFPVMFTNRFPLFAAKLLKPADFDGDGDLDVFLAAQSPRPLEIFSNSGNGQLFAIDVLPSELLGPVKDVAGEWADFDGDDQVDLVVSGRYEATEAPFTAILWNRAGHFTFSSLNEESLSPVRGPVQVGDIDGDGDIDIVQCGNTSDGPSLRLRIFLNHQGNYTAHDQILADDGVGVNALLLADFDGNGLPDLSLHKATGSLVFLNAGNLAFETVTTPWTGEGGTLLATADLNGDGLIDGVGAPDSTESLATSVFINSPGANFSTKGLLGSSANQIAVGDVNGDGNSDLLIRPHLPDSALIKRQLAQGEWVTSESLPGTGYQSVALGDFDGDGDLDVLASLSDGSEVSSDAGPVTLVLLNHQATGKPAPSVPLSPTAAILPNGTSRLSWAPALQPAPTNGFTYNVRLGTRAGAGDVLPAHSLPDGHRLLPQPGNAGAHTSFDLKLPPGTYFWAVQAVDASYVGGHFTAEQSFVVPEPPGPAAVQLVPNANGELSVRLQAAPGASVWLERSRDLKEWSQVRQVPLDARGEAVFDLDSDQHTSPSFFRLRPAD